MSNVVTINSLRKSLLRIILRIGAIVGVPGTFIGLLLNPEGFNYLAPVGLGIVVVAAIGEKFPYRLRAIAPALAFYLVGISELWSGDEAGGSRLFFLASSLILVILLGPRPAYASVGVIAVSIIAVQTFLGNDAASWISSVPGTVLVSVVLIASISFIFKRLLLSEEELFRSQQIVTSSSDMIAMIDKELRFQKVNNAYAAALGRSLQDVESRTPDDFFEQEFLQATFNPSAERCMTGEAVRIRDWVEFPELGRRYIDITFSPYFDEDNTVIGFIFDGRDITENKIAREEKEESDARSSSVIEHASDAIITIDEKGIIESVNPAAETLFGYENSELINQSVNILMPQPYQNEHDGYLEKYIQTGIKNILDRTREVPGLHKDGFTFPIRLSVSEILFGDKRLFTGIVHDMTREVELEKQLLQGQKLESLGTLAGGIAHDFNNILQAILGYTDMARENMGDDRELLKQCLTEIETGGRRGADLVNQILTFSRESNVETESMQLPPLLESALKFLRSSIPANIQIESNIDADCGPVKANATQIQQLVTNLGTNAMHSMEETGGTLTISLVPFAINASRKTLCGTLAPGEYVQLSVADTGTGIQSDKIEKILDPFFTTKDVGKGTGLGLAMVHGIVSSMNGGLIIESELNHGTAVRVLLPTAKTKLVRRPVEASANETLNGDIRVFVVDDEEPVAKSLVLLLKNRGIRADSFYRVDRALEAFRNAPEAYDVAIVDFMMPGKTGLEFAQELFSLNADVPIILATGLIDDSRIEKSKSPNIAEIVQKPYRIDDIARIINRVISNGDDANNGTEPEFE
jgi:PAS domain S-box-containing protein